MKKLYSLFLAAILSSIIFAQSPQKMSYQAVIRNSSNALVTSSPVGMRISILQGSVTGTAVYVETQTPTTNANGLVSIEIGGGTVVTGTFASIDWSTGVYFIKTETDPAGGTSYAITGTSQLLSVPYALYAKTAEGISGTITASQVSDFQTTVTNNTAVLANTAKNSYPTDDAIKLAAITGTNTGDETTATIKTKLGITTLSGINTGDQTLSGLGGVASNTPITGATKTKITYDTKGLVTSGADATTADITASTDKNYVTNAQLTALATIPTAHTIGESYGGGIVFYIYDNGQHGLIAATADQGTGIVWTTAAFLSAVSNAVRDGVNGGLTNTESIIIQAGAESYAAQLCANYQGGNYADWYLPSKYELNLLYLQKTVVGGFANYYYWSSTEYNIFNAWAQTFDDGYQNGNTKNGPYYVRAIRAF